MSNEKNEVLDKKDGGSKKTTKSRTAASGKQSANSKSSRQRQTSNSDKTPDRANSPKRTKRLSNEAKGILVIALSIFAALCVFTGGQAGVVGAVGGFFKNILMGLFGSASYIFFIIIFFAGLNLFIDKKENSRSYNPWLIASIFIIASVIGALIYDDTSFGDASEFFEEIVGMYEYGIDGYGGGILGGLLCRLICMLIGKIGGWILTLSIALVLVIMLTGVSIEKIIKQAAFSFKSHAANVHESMNAEVDADFDEEEFAERARLKREKAAQRRLKKKGGKDYYTERYTPEDAANKNDRYEGERYGPIQNDYFELYFSGEDIETSIPTVKSGKSRKKDYIKDTDTNFGVKSTAIEFDPFGDDDLTRDSESDEFSGNPIRNIKDDNDDIVITSFEVEIDENKPEMEQISEVVSAVANLKDNSDTEVETVKIPRFSFNQLENNLFADFEEEEESDLTEKPEPEDNEPTLENSDLSAPLPDDNGVIDNNKLDSIISNTPNNTPSGILTEIPTDMENYTGVVENEEGTDFEPPSLVQLSERLDVPVKKARDAGVPMDRAFTSVKNNTVKEAAETANSIENDIKKNEEEIRIKSVNYQLPTVDILEEIKPRSKSMSNMKAELEDKANRLLETLASFKVEAKIINITHGPTVTRFELQPGPGIKVSKITNLADDIALSLAASGVRIEAPIPGKSAIGIEIPNGKPSPVPIREVIDTDKFRAFNSKTAFALGKDIGGNCVIADIAQFPHILIAGATGSGKSVCINSLIMSILFKAKPDEVKLIMVDPKMVELGVYNGIPHLLIPVVTDPKHASGALNWAVVEMKNRYNLLKDNKVRNIQGYNELMEQRNEPDAKLPEIVIIIDELADLMMAAKSEVEDAINSLAALARAAGMYLVIATQRPSVDVITGVIKANVPSRISFAVSSQIDSRTIIDSPGAEKLLGRGDMLYCPRGAIKPMRIQGNFVSDREIEDIIEFIKSQYEADYDEEIIEHIERERELVDTKLSDETTERHSGGAKDETYLKAVELVLECGQASVAMLQRKLKIGYQKAARIIDKMEEERVIGPYEGTKPRQVLITRAEFNEMMFNNLD